ncbi:hypothetical protein HN587_03435 [Candidatus Woesearchaeota archaeon]|jgi:hypothetical protein|nr:hypothetical protein [Candidatus Woesearchaeota archaeon]
MVLDNKTIDKIKAFVYAKPRAVNEIAQMLGKNWRTADRYIEEISKRTGHIQMRVFREGSRGALKIVFWNNLEKIYATDIQEKLFAQMEKGIEKNDFSPIEIYQYVDPEKRDGYFEEITPNYQYNAETLFPLIDNAEEEVLAFSGNNSWIHLKHDGRTLLDSVRDAVKRGVIFKIITNVALLDLKNLRDILAINIQMGKEMVQVKHEITPLRAYIIDGKIAKFSEIKVPAGKKGEDKKILGVYYSIYDPEWVEWIKQVFWKKFQLALPAKKRIDSLEGLHKYTGMK